MSNVFRFPSLPKTIFQKKKAKKKAMKECGDSGEPKGNGIKEGPVRWGEMPNSAENKITKKWALGLCRSLLAALCGGRHTTLAALFSLFCQENQFIKKPTAFRRLRLWR
ncbi:hypothetical protein FAZ19_15725 [Sphingobacterium alkalisoli]|uniref:Uncharacterized protein n=1 Tax=Sphingobacterium alkalisoli TaxID=1874115 RepID=A0A4V5LXS2_9SPHI|nr:hypothetical protein [Sphingobacterium alkalisoli]TJY63719.1 hypothetical protein FAZ19_15725 [Sphingobacterium alkalisoli]